MYLYLSPVTGALYSMIVGSRMALATPCGVSYTAPSVCAMECTMPRPTLLKPMPATYWPSAMPSKPSASPATAARRDLAMISIALRWNMSVISQAPLVMKPSMAWVSASMPVAAVRPLGMEDIMSGSTTATSGMSCTSTQTNLRFFSTSVIT